MNAKQWKGKMWLKIVALLVATITGMGVILGSVMMLVSMSSKAQYPNSEAIIEDIQERMLHNYAAQLVDNKDSDEQWSLLEGQGVIYAVDKITFNVKGAAEEAQMASEVELVYGDTEQYNYMRENQDVPKTGIQYYDFFEEQALNYDTSSLRNILYGEVYAHEIDNVNGQMALIYNEQGYQLRYHSYTEETMEEGQNANPPEGTYTIYRVYMMADQEVYKKTARDVISPLSAGENLYTATPSNLPRILSKMYNAADTIRFKSNQVDYLWVPYVVVQCVNLMTDFYLPFFVVSLVMFVASFILLMVMSGHREEDEKIHTRFMDRVPFVIYGTMAVIGVALGMCGNIGIVWLFLESIVDVTGMVVLSVMLATLWILLGLAFCMSVATRIKTGEFFRYTLCHWLMSPFRKIFSLIRENVKLSIRITIVLCILFAVEVTVLASSCYSSFVMFCFFVYKIAETALIYYVILMMNRLQEGGKRVANGDYEQPIDTTHMISAFKEHADNINNVSNGISKAVEEQMKSERMKTELITNVSHDIKTPLTSIINYVDLIKKAGVEDATVVEYLDVLERQSARLKKLIEDLMEASKASSGNLEVNMQACDVGVMISQVVAEYQEKLQQQGIEVIVNTPDAPMNIMADGRHLYRVLDNIMGNINKYAMNNTRVYVDVEVGLHQTKMTFKNVSRYPLNISSDELMERFVRGDSSRNTEGNGLGLSIAQSLTELMGGNLELEIDGDLFKVIVTVKR